MGKDRDSKILRFSFVLDVPDEVDNFFGRRFVEKVTMKIFPSMREFFESDDSKKLIKIFGPYRGRSGIVFDVTSLSYEIAYLILKAFKDAKEEIDKIIFLGRYERFPSEIKDRKYLRLRIQNVKSNFSMLDELVKSGYDMRRFHGIEPRFDGLKRIKILWFERKYTINALVDIECEWESCWIVEFLRFRGIGEESCRGFGDVTISEISQ